MGEATTKNPKHLESTRYSSLENLEQKLNFNDLFRLFWGEKFTPDLPFGTVFGCGLRLLAQILCNFQNPHQPGKSRWHSYHVLIYISPVLTYLLGTVIAMYFDHEVT